MNIFEELGRIQFAIEENQLQLKLLNKRKKDIINILTYENQSIYPEGRGDESDSEEDQTNQILDSSATRV